MSLKFSVDSLDGLDEHIAGLYAAHDDGKFYLQVDGAVAKSRLDEFRNNNIELKKQLESFEGVDVNEYKELKKKKEVFEKLDSTVEEKVEAQVSERVKTMQEEFENEKTTLSEKLSTLQSQLDVLLIDSAVRKDAVESGVLPSAVDDVLLRAKTVFKVVDGVATPHDEKGNVIYGKNGADPMTISEWVSKLSKDAPHLFEQSSGGGAGGSRGQGGQNIDPSKLTPLQKIQAGLSEG